jgi:cation transport ATPase
MGEGAALAMEMSDITLMDSNLEKLSYIIELGRKVMITIRENILLSLACKIVVVSLTFLGKMTLLYAIASDVGVMLIVTLNGMKVLPGLGSTAETMYSELSDDSADSLAKRTMEPSMKINNTEIV